MKILVITELVVIVIFALNWAKYYFIGLNLIYYMLKKGYDMPSDDEFRECIRDIITKFFGGDKK